MKKLFLSAVAFGALLTAQAQTFFSESFDTEIPATWTILEEDGLTSSSPQSAYASWAWNSNSERASSTSWYDNSGTGPTDDLVNYSTNFDSSDRNKHVVFLRHI